MPQAAAPTSADWYTPPQVFAPLNDELGPFTLDVAANAENAKAPAYYTEAEDGPRQPWTGRVWCNPPYRDILRWVKRAREATASGEADIVVMLLPAQTSTAWFHDWVLPFAEVRFVRGKIRFGGAPYNAMSPSLVVVFRRPE